MKTRQCHGTGQIDIVIGIMIVGGAVTDALVLGTPLLWEGLVFGGGEVLFWSKLSVGVFGLFVGLAIEKDEEHGPGSYGVLRPTSEVAKRLGWAITPRGRRIAAAVSATTVRHRAYPRTTWSGEAQLVRVGLLGRRALGWPRPRGRIG